MQFILHPIINTIVNDIRGIGGRVFIVGGAVRDSLMGIEPDDIDFEVFNISGTILHTILERHGRITVAGKFSIFTFHIDNRKYDFSLPRRDNKTGRGYTAFDIVVDPFMTVEEAASRRDFTINAVMVELPDGFIYDFFNGRGDIINKRLRAVSNKFSEDPMRVMRGFQFASRFGFSFDLDTTAMAMDLLKEADTLDSNLLRKQWTNWAMGKFPSHALFELVSIGWDTVFPALNNLIGVPQDPVWHPEGDVFTHTRHVVDSMRRIIERDAITGDRAIVLMLAALLHDVGKPATTVKNDAGRWTSPDHANAGIPIAQEFLDQIGIANRIKAQVLPLIREHMIALDGMITARGIRRLAMRLAPATIEDLALLIEADYSGRPPIPAGMPDHARKLLTMSTALQVTSGLPQPIIMGRHLIEAGLTPGVMFRDILDRAFEAQLNGEFTTVEEGKQWLHDSI